MGVLFGTEIRQYWWENNAKFFAVQFLYFNDTITTDEMIICLQVNK